MSARQGLATKDKKQAQKGARQPQTSSLGLEGIGDLSDLLSQPVSTPAATGMPLELDINLIDEDPNQPRKSDNPGFSHESLSDLAESIKARGVKTPISVRPHPEIEGRFIINHGARRYRGSKMAGKSIIPGFIDPDYVAEDQVIENVQRENLTPREIADFIGRELAKGKKKLEIAKSIGKSPAFITQYAALLDLPDPIAEAFNQGRCSDVTVINELITAFKKAPKEVTGWLSDESQELTRGAVKVFREFLDDKKQAAAEQEGVGVEGDHGSKSESGAQKEMKSAKGADQAKLKKVIVQVQYQGRPARLVLNRRPLASGHAWLRFEDDGAECEAELTQVKLIALVEG